MPAVLLLALIVGGVFWLRRRKKRALSTEDGRSPLVTAGVLPDGWPPESR
jgi:hypothetical protein